MATRPRTPLADRCGSRIRRRRQLAGLSLRQLGDATSIHFTHLWAMEQGRTLPGFVQLRSLCRVLGVDGDYLLCRSGR